MHARPDSLVARSPDAEVEAAMQLLSQIRQIATDPDARADILPLVQKLGLRLGLNFVEAIKGKKRRVRRLAGGELRFGDRLIPFEGRQRPSPDGEGKCASGSHPEPSRQEPGQRPQTKTRAKASPGPNPLPFKPLTTKAPPESISFTKVSRGERIRTSDFLLPKQAETAFLTVRLYS